jgi:hypothetical protein
VRPLDAMATPGAAGPPAQGGALPAVELTTTQYFILAE